MHASSYAVFHMFAVTAEKRTKRSARLGHGSVCPYPSTLLRSLRLYALQSLNTPTPRFFKRDDFEAGSDLKQVKRRRRMCSSVRTACVDRVAQAKKAAEAAAGGGQVSPASPVATTPKIALDKSVHIRELKCALCGGPFTEGDIETANGQRS